MPGTSLLCEMRGTHPEPRCLGTAWYRVQAKEPPCFCLFSLSCLLPRRRGKTEECFFNLIFKLRG